MKSISDDAVVQTLLEFMDAIDELTGAAVYWDDEAALERVFEETTRRMRDFLAQSDESIVDEFDAIEPTDDQLSTWRDHSRGVRLRIVWYGAEYYRLLSRLQHSRLTTGEPNWSCSGVRYPEPPAVRRQ